MDALPNRYEVLETVDATDRGELLKARDRNNDRLVALKTIRIDDGRRSPSEAALLLDIPPHPGLPTVRHDFDDGDRRVIVLDWIDGTNLGTILDERGSPGLPVRDVVRYVGEIGRALEHLHQQSVPIVHADVNPGNVILTSDGNVVLVDFGTAVPAGGIVSGGTSGYLAPEAAARAPVGPSADVYGLAATAVCLLTGRPPAKGRPLLEGVNPVEVEHLAPVLRRALRTMPEDRTSSVAEFAEALAMGLHAPWAGELCVLVVALAGDPAVRQDDPAHAAVIDRLDGLVSAAVDRNGGQLLRSVARGYRRWSAYPTVSAAVAAASAMHAAVADSHWPKSFAGLGAAIDIGALSYREGGHSGGPIDRLSRLVEVVPPDVTILTRTAAAELPAQLHGSELRPVRLASDSPAGAATELVAVVRPGSPEITLAGAGADVAHSTLPARANAFIGREDELDLVLTHIAGQRLCTVTGATGIGKSRLATEAAGRVGADFADGVWYVDLAARARRQRTAAFICSAVGLQDSGSGTYAGTRSERRPASDRLSEHFRGKHALLVMDNLDVEDRDVRRLIAELVGRCGRLSVLVSSRQRLQIDGESVLRIGALALPAQNAGPEQIGASAAVKLFVERATRVRPGFSPDDRALAIIADLCRDADGIPLAIELLATRVGVLSLDELVDARADGRHEELGGRSEAVSESVLGLMVRASVDVLGQAERAVFGRLAVFAGGFTLQAAAAVCGGPEAERDVRETVADLVGRSLIEPDPGAGDQRFHMLTVFRRFSEQLLEVDPTVDSARDRHLRYFADLSRRFRDNQSGPEGGEWSDRIEADLDNVLVACDWAQDCAPHTAVEMISDLGQFWIQRGRISEGRALMRRALAASGARFDPATTGLGWLTIATLSCFAGDIDDAVITSRRAWEACRLSAKRELAARSEVVLGQVALLDSDPALGLERTLAAVSAASEHGDQALLAVALTNAGNAELRAGSPGRALSTLQRALDIRQGAGDAFGLTWTRLRMATVLLAADDHGDAEAADRIDRARRHLAEALDCADRARYATGSLLATLCLAEVSLRMGEPDAAREQYTQVCKLARIARDEVVEALGISGLIDVALVAGSLEEAVDLLSRQEEITSQSDLVSSAALLRSRALVDARRGLASAAVARHRGALLAYSRMFDANAVRRELADIAGFADRFGLQDAVGSLHAPARVAESEETPWQAVSIALRVRRG